MVEIDGEKLMVSSSNFDDGSMIVSVGTTDFNNYGDSDFMEIMINKDGKIDYFTLPVGKDDYQRMYKIKPSHYGTMKTQNETNESAGGDFIRTDGDGKYGTSFGAEDIDDYIQRIFTFIDEKVGTEYFGSIEDEEEVIRFKQAFMDKFNEIEEPSIIDWNEIFSAESFGAEEGQFYQLEIKSNMADGWEWVADFTNQQDAINAYYEHYDKHPEVQIVEVDSDGDGEVLLKTRNYNLGAESFGAESKMCSYCKTTDLKNFSQGWDDYCMACARRHHREYGAESFRIRRPPEILAIVNPSGRSENDDPRKLYVSIGFDDGEIYRGYVELDSEYEMDEEGYERKKAKSFGAEFAGYEDPISERQRYRIRKLGGRIDKAMSRSDASRYIKSLMAMPLHAETTDCSACQGWGWNEDLNMVCDADGCIGGWVVPKKPSLLERGLELGAGVGMGMAGVAILFGFLGGTVGFAAEELKNRRD